MTDTFHPDDWVSPPGETIADVRQARGWTRGCSPTAPAFRAHTEQLISGDAPINATVTENADDDNMRCR